MSESLDSFGKYTKLMRELARECANVRYTRFGILFRTRNEARDFIDSYCPYQIKQRIQSIDDTINHSITNACTGASRRNMATLVIFFNNGSSISISAATETDSYVLPSIEQAFVVPSKVTYDESKLNIIRRICQKYKFLNNDMLNGIDHVSDDVELSVNEIMADFLNNL